MQKAQVVVQCSGALLFCSSMCEQYECEINMSEWSATGQQSAISGQELTLLLNSVIQLRIIISVDQQIKF